jgi:tripartite-type tricarboxylate transporter receptor subunit TctC
VGWGVRISLAAAAVLAAGCSSAVGSPSSTGNSAGPAAPDVGYFHGKTITYDVPAAPGTSSYLSAQILAPVVGKYLNATVNLVSVPAGNGIAGQNMVSAARPDGLTIGTLNVNIDLQLKLTHQQGVNFDIARATIIAGELRSPSLVVARPDSSFTTLTDALNSKAKFTVIDDSGGSDEQLRVLFGAYGAKAHVLSGYADAGSVVQGFLRGDGAVTQQSLADLQGAISAGKAIPLILNSQVGSTVPDYGKLKNVPTLQSYFEAHKPATPEGQKAMEDLVSQFTNASPNQVVFTAAGTPAAETAALRAAFKHALESPAVRAQFVRAGLTPGYISSAQTMEHIKSAIVNGPALSHFLTYSYNGS